MKRKSSLQETYQRCPILVGNGEFRTEYGATINCFKCVVRFNRFKINGFEDMVGTKTDIVVANPQFVANEAYRAKQLWWTTRYSAATLYTDFHTFVSSYTGFQLWMEEAPGFMQELDVWKGLLAEANKTPGLQFSSGLMGALFLLRLVPVIVITGFDWARAGHYFNPDHPHLKSFDWEWEKEVFQKLVEAGRVVHLHKVLSDMAPLETT